jgi:hypothetical protein
MPDPPFLLGADETRSFQGGDVLEQRGQRHRLYAGEARDWGLAERELGQDGSASRVGERRERRIQEYHIS